MSNPQRLYLMQVAYSPERNIPVVCYLIQTDDGRNILIDTGLPDAFTPPPGLNPVMDKNVLEQLAQIGVQPGEVDTLICTHFDMDHCGHHSAFINAELVIQRDHYVLGQESPRFAANRAEWHRPDARVRLIEGDLELLPGVQILRTDGHTFGHQSVLIHLSESGPVLLTIDAVPTQSLFRANRQPSPVDEDPVAVQASVQKLLDTVEREGVGLTVFGHDGDQWKGLKKLPEYYS